MNVALDLPIAGVTRKVLIDATECLTTGCLLSLFVIILTEWF